jgi:hypothetical protein
MEMILNLAKLVVQRKLNAKSARVIMGFQASSAFSAKLVLYARPHPDLLPRGEGKAIGRFRFCG